MLKWVLATALVCAASGAQAADYADLPVLRGSLREQTSTGRNWDGWYAGGQFGYSAGNLDFSHASQSLTDFMLRNSVLQVPVQSWALLEAKDATSLGFGGFVGRNWQWEDAVIGIELNYTNLRGLSNSSGSTMSLQLLNPTGSTPPTGSMRPFPAGPDRVPNSETVPRPPAPSPPLHSGEPRWPAQQGIRS